MINFNSYVSCKPQVYPAAWNNRRGISFFVQSCEVECDYSIYLEGHECCDDLDWDSCDFLG